MPKLLLSLAVLAILLLPLGADAANPAPEECVGPDDPFCHNPLDPTNQIDEDAGCKECELIASVWSCEPVEVENVIGRTICEIDKNGDCEERGSFCEIIFVQP